MRGELPVWGAAVAALLAVAAASTAWQPAVDGPLLAYIAFAIDRLGLAPYRDLYDFNTGGAYLANIAIGRVFGYSALGFRLGDLTALATLLSITAIALRGFGWRSALAGPLLFGFFYLGYGPVMSLQREFLLLLPLALAIAVAFEEARRVDVRALVIGALLGMATTIKPQAVMLLPVFAGWLWWTAHESQTSSERWWLAWGGLGFLLPLGAVTLWLDVLGSLGAFVDIADNYWPLYNQLTGARPHRIIEGWEAWSYRLQRFVLSRDIRHVILIPAVAGAWVAFQRSALDSTRKRHLALLVLVATALELYPLAGGKFWGYHWLPSFYGASLLAGLCLWPTDATSKTKVPRDFAAAMLVVMLTAQTPTVLRSIRDWQRGQVNRGGATALAIASELAPRLRAGDVVQPLDWTGGAVHAMLLTEARIATPFLYDFYFYHHVSMPYIQSLRRQLLAGLGQRPAFVITADQTERLTGPGTTTGFTELEDILRRDYRAVAGNGRWAIYERNDHALAANNVR